MTEDTIENKRKECDAFPTDEEVEARERKVAAKSAAYKRVTKWSVLPAASRGALGGAVLLMTAACHLAGNFGTRWGPPDVACRVIDTHFEPSCVESNGILRRRRGE